MKNGTVDIHNDPKDLKLYHKIWEADECLEVETGGETAFRVVSAVILLLRDGQTDGTPSHGVVPRTAQGTVRVIAVPVPDQGHLSDIHR